MSSFSLQLSQPARMQGWMVTCFCGHSGCIVAAWTPCPVPSHVPQPADGANTSGSFLSLFYGDCPTQSSLCDGDCLFYRASKTPCPWSRRRRKSKTRYPHSNVLGPNQKQMPAAISENKNTAFFTWQPLLLLGKPAPPLLSLHSSALYHSLDAQTSIVF